MRRTACTEPHCLYKGALSFFYSAKYMYSDRYKSLQGRLLSRATKTVLYKTLIWSGSMEVAEERRTSSANFWKENI